MNEKSFLYLLKWSSFYVQSPWRVCSNLINVFFDLTGTHFVLFWKWESRFGFIREKARKSSVLGLIHKRKFGTQYCNKKILQ